MVRLPDIPQQTWLDDQVNRFKETTSGYLDALFFDDDARRQEADIPPDFDAPGGRDQWEQAAQQRREEELRRQQEEDERRIREQQAADQARMADEAQRAQMQAEARQTEQAQQASGYLSNLGIPSPEEAFSQFTGVFNRPQDNASSTGVLDAMPASPSPQPAAEQISPSPAAMPSSPAGDFLSWAQGLTEPLLGSFDASPTATADSGSIPDSGPESDHSSSSGVFDVLGQGARTFRETVNSAGQAIDESVFRPVRENPVYQTAVQGGMPDAAHIIPEGVRSAGETVEQYGLGAFDREQRRTRELELEQRAFLGDQASVRQSLMPTDIDPRWEAAHPEKAAELRRLHEDFSLNIGGMAGAGNIRVTDQAIQAIKALRAANIGEDVVLAAERQLAQTTRGTLEEIQALTRGAATPPASVAAEGRPSPPSGTTSAATEAGATSSQRALELGQEVITPDGKVGKVGSRAQIRINGETEHRVSIYHPDGSITKLTPDQVRPSGRPMPPVSAEERAAQDVIEAVRQPTPQEAAQLRVLPEPPSARGPQRPGEGPAPTPELVDAALVDGDKIDAMLQRTRGRSGSRPPTPDDVKRMLGAMSKAQGAWTDRRAGLGIMDNLLEELRGRKLMPNESVWTLARVYEGREDAALARIERMLHDPLTNVGPQFVDDIERTMIQLDNVGVDWLARTKEQGRVEATIPRVRARQQAPVNEVRRTGEAALNEQRARSNMRGAEREWIGATNERNALLKEMDTLGEGPTRGVESEYARRKRAQRGYGPDRVMETDRSLSAQERLERVNIRLETAKARHADARRIVDDLVAAKRDTAEGKTRARAVERADVVGDARKYSGEATPQDVDAILEALVKRVGPEKAKDITDAIDALYRYRDMNRERSVAAGIWSRATGDEFNEVHPYYVPTKILEKMDTGFLDNLPTGARTFSSRNDMIKHIRPEGTTADRMTPIRSILEAGFQTEAIAQRNTIMQSVAGWADQPGMEQFVKKLKASAPAPVGYKKMAALFDGEAQSVAVVEPLAKFLEMAPPGFSGLSGTILHALTAPTRLGATGLRPAFIATNAVNDAIGTLFRFAAERPGYDILNPVSRAQDLYDLFKGYHLAMGAARPATQAGTGAFVGGAIESAREAGEGNFPWNDPDYWKKLGAAATVGAGVGLARRLAPVDRATIQRFRESGASIGMQSRFTYPDDIVRRLSGEGIVVRTLTSENDFNSWLANRAGRISDVAGLLWSRPLAEVGAVIERAPRYAAFMRAEGQAQGAIGRELRAARKSGAVIGADQEAQIREALMDAQMPEIANKARRVTSDFAAGGTFAKAINQLSPFFNPALQGAVEAGALMRKNPAGFTAASAAVVAATMYTEIYNRAVAPDDYKNVSEFTKNTGLVVLSDMKPEGEGKRGLVYIPTRGYVGLLVPLVKAAMGIAFGDDPRTWQKLAWDTGVATVNQMSPVQADIGGLTGMFVPPVLSQVGQARMNYDAFRDQPIISRSMESLPSSEQYDDRTSQLARHLARSGIPLLESPIMTDWAIKGFSPGPGEALLSAADQIIKASGKELPSTARNVPPGARDAPVFGPILGRFLRTVGSAEQNRAYERADELAARDSVARVRELEAMPAYQNATPDRQKQMMRSLQNAMTEKAQTESGVEPKPKDLGQPVRWNGIEPGSDLEREIVSAIGTNADDRTNRQKSLARYYQGKQTRTYTEWRKRQTRESESVRELVR